MQPIFAGIARSLFAPVLAVLLMAGHAWGAQLHWQALPDRERITISMSPSEGLAGPVGRIASTGVLVPFTEVPSGLNVEQAPDGARIFKSTKHLGRSLILETQTPEFGYLLVRQTPVELVLDFFHNPLGARWRPTAKAPTTELPPDSNIPPIAPPDETTRALAEDPQNTGMVTTPSGNPAQPAFASPFDASADPAGPPAGAAQSPPSEAAVQPQTQLQSQPPAAVQPSAPEQAKPVVVVLPGTPEHAATATRFAEPDVSPSSGQPAPFSPPPRPNVPENANPAAHNDTRPLPDPRTQTDGRAAPLPVPVPAVAPAPQSNPAPQQTAPAQPPQLPPQSAAPSFPAGRAYAAEQPMPVTAPQPVAAAQPEANPVPPPPGVGTRTSGTTYGGTVNTGGLDNIPELPPSVQAQPGQYAQPQAQPQQYAEPQAQPQQYAQPQQQTPPPAQPQQAMQPQQAAQPQAQPQQYTQPQAAAAPGPGARDHGPTGQTAAAAPEPKAGETPDPNAATVVYVDKEGNPVPPPANPKALLPEIRQHISNSEFPQALEKAELLLNEGNIDAAEREELLHVRAEMLFVLNKDLDQHFKLISDATIQAINFNQKSPRNAGALLRLGYMNLRLKNIPEAEARFNMLRRLFPDDENVPLTYYYWGDYFFQRNELQKAADEFQYLLQKYPNSRYAREGALGLARSFYRLGYYQQSFNVVDYIERRWERFYIEYPPFLNMMGDVAFRLNKLDYALKHYWLYVNLEPQGEEADIILTRIGDIYSMQGEHKAAKELYNESIRRFPDKDGALVAMMRLAENSVNDDPTIAGMIAVFDGPFSMAPVEVYRTIIQQHPQSALVPLAEVKLAMWHLWKHEYIETLDTTAAFLQKYPEHELAEKAREVALQTFAILSAESMAEGRYARMREIWERYPIVHGQEGILPAESRIALGVSYWKDGKPDEALRAVEPFFLGRKVPEYSEMALSLVLNIYLEHQQWRSVREVGKRVDLWELSPESQQLLDYSLAFAAENLNESEQAVPLWQKLYDSGTLPASQMAYAAFFLAREAEKQRELEKAYGLGREALSRLIEQAERNPNSADLSKIRTQLSSLMDVAETAGRLREALGFAEQYLQYLPAEDSERVAVRYRTARIYRKQGNLDAWKKTLTDISASNPGTVYGQLADSELRAAEIAQDAARYSPTGRI